MPAKIVVTDPAGGRREFWIQDRVLRLGRDPKCDVELPAPAPSHAATLEYQGGAYYLYNRSPGPIRVAGRDVSAGAKATWPANTDLDLAGGATLRLEVDGSPEPAPAPRAVDEYEGPGEEAEAPPAAAPPGGGKQAAQVAIAALSFVAAGFIGYQAAFPPEEAPKRRASGLSYPKIVAAAERPEYAATAAEPEFADILRDLRQAEVMAGRGDLATARRYYQRVVGRLRTKRTSDFRFESKLEDAVHRYATERIEATTAAPPERGLLD